MIYDPLLCDLASLPLTMLVEQAREQTEDGQIACFCPFCHAVDDDGHSHSTPHFIVYQRKRGGLYGKPVEHWQCTKTRRSGYGAIELYAAIHGYGYWWRKDEYSPYTFICEGENLRQTCMRLMKKTQDGEEKLRRYYPQLLKRDFRTEAPAPLEQLAFQIKADFTPQDLASLGCPSWIDRNGNEAYAFDTQNPESDWHFKPYQIQQDFKVYAVLQVTLPAVSRKGQPYSEVIHSNPWNPMFVCFTDDQKNAGAIFRPAMDVAPIVFSNSGEHSTAKVSRWLAGDKVFTRATELRVTDNTGVLQAIAESGGEEPYRETKRVLSTEKTDQGTKAGYVDEPIRDKDVRAKSVIYCASAQDAISTYYYLKALRHSYPKAYGSRWWHVCFPYGQVPFSPVHYNKMNRFADNIYTLFPLTQQSMTKAFYISRRYRDVLRVKLPEQMNDPSHLYSKRIFAHPVSSVRDFFLTYKMSPGEAFTYDSDINRFFNECLSSALCSNPFKRNERLDKSGNVKEVYYTIDTSTLWEFMASVGYARDVSTGTSNKIGRYVRIDGPFADELDAPSMVQATRENLKAYARQLNASRPGEQDEYGLMVQAVEKASKEINEKTITSLPQVTLNYTDGYGPQIEHFFYENGALQITPNEITMHSYDSIDFNVERSEVLPWNVSVIKNVPFEITENPEYLERKNKVEAMKMKKDDLGKPLYTQLAISLAETELAIWAQSHRWVVDWKGKKEHELWPPLRVLRGFANEEWEREQELQRDGKEFSSEEQMELDCRFANLIFCLGRSLWRNRDSKSNCIAYLIENVVSAANRAEGGSGKSTFVRIFAGCAAHILNINGRDLVTSREFSSNLAEYQHHKHRIVHWEDVDALFEFNKLYNLTTGNFSVRYMYKDRMSVPLSEGPGHIVTSNYPLHDLDDSTMRRVCLGGFSHRFCGQNIMKNKAARYISDIMPDFNAVYPEKLSAASRNQIAMIDALAVQFVMRYDEKVEAQKKFMEQRTLTQSLGEAFLRFARVFFAQDYIYGVPVDLDSMLDEYKADFAEASKNKNDSFSPKAFKRRVLDYCETAGITMNPVQLFTKANGKVLAKASETNYFAHKAWCTHRFFEGAEWERDSTVAPKQIRELVRTEHAVYFYRNGRDDIPKNNDELMRRYEEFLQRPDPSPILDESGNPVTLTVEEQERWRNYLDGRQRKRVSQPMPMGASLMPANPDTPKQDFDCPF